MIEPATRAAESEPATTNTPGTTGTPSTPGASGTATPLGAGLTYRIARDDDLPLLLAYREECGWGADYVKDAWRDPDRPLCVFQVEGEDGRSVDIGMGGWILEQPGTASKVDGWVKLSSLFIANKYQKYGYGRLAMDSLEQLAVELYGARVITLDTAAYEGSWAETEDGHRYCTDIIGVESRNVKWYKRRGFVTYGDPVPTYPSPRPGDLDYKVHSVKLKKVVKTE